VEIIKIVCAYEKMLEREKQVTELHERAKRLPPPERKYGVAYVYPNGSYILLMWVFNSNQYPIDEGTLGVEERFGFWGPYGNPIDNISFQPAPLNGIIPPFSFRTEDRWPGLFVNELVYEKRLFQPAASEVL
ncbi:MAG: hypothetical protein ACP5GH_07410, partial [Nitrososphaeria archaeon]